MPTDPFRQSIEAPSRRDGERQRLLDIEERLAADADGAYRRDLLDRLATARTALRRALDRGVPPDEYRRLLCVIDACDAAAAVVEDKRPRAAGNPNQ